MSSTPDSLKVDKVHVWRGDRHVLQGVSIEVHPRELLHVSGPNGTGKSSIACAIALGLNFSPTVRYLSFYERSVLHPTRSLAVPQN